MVQKTHDPQVGAAIGLILFGVMGGLGLDLCAKAILETYPLEQFVFLRSLIGITLFLLLARQFGGLRSLVTRRWAWHLLRTLLASGAMFGFFFGLSKMPLIDALTLGFTAPLIMTALSVPLLGEYPGTGTFSPAAMSVLFAALCYACLAITARKLADTESTFSLSVYVIAGPMIISGLLSIDGDWKAPDAIGWTLFLVAGMCSVIAFRVHGAGRGCDRRLPYLGRSTGPLGDRGRADHYFFGPVYRLSRSRGRSINALPACANS
jgi:drug/metabolite transporter (DMT)-like permease